MAETDPRTATAEEMREAQRTFSVPGPNVNSVTYITDEGTAVVTRKAAAIFEALEAKVAARNTSRIGRRRYILERVGAPDFHCDDFGQCWALGHKDANETGHTATIFERHDDGTYRPILNIQAAGNVTAIGGTLNPAPLAGEPGGPALANTDAWVLADDDERDLMHERAHAGISDPDTCKRDDDCPVNNAELIR